MDQNIIAFILGIVEGATEFLPVSSTGHMIIVGDFLGFSDEKAGVFEVFIQLGAILSVFLLYREKFMTMLSGKIGRGATVCHWYIFSSVCCRLWSSASSDIPLLKMFCSRRLRLSLVCWRVVCSCCARNGFIRTYE